MLNSRSLENLSLSSFRYLALISLWLLVWWAAMLLEYQPYISLWYPPAGLSLAAFILIGRRAFLPVLAAATLVGFWMYWQENSQLSILQQAQHSLLLGSAHTIAFALGGFYFRRFVGSWDIQHIPQRVLYFLIIIFLTTLLGAWLGLIAFYLIDTMTPADVLNSWLAWWIGDLAGALVLTPFFMLVLGRIWQLDTSWLRPLNVKVSSAPLYRQLWSKRLVLMLALVMVVLGADYLFGHPAIAYFIFFLSVPQLWIVYTESIERSLLSLALTSFFIAAWFGFVGVDDHALTYQFALCVIAANTYFGLSVPSLLQQNKQLHQQTQIDSLTQVASRNYFLACAERQLSGRRSRDFPISLMVFDLDEFKAINDDFGHLVGDQALIMAAQSIRAHIRQCDVIGRFGGDEFLLLLPDQNLEDAHRTAERLRSKLPAIPVATGMIQIKASFGIVEIKADEDVNEALQRADKALLKAKRNGRDQVVSFI
ncbi:sensor domain-containing diguanylate cyclase [Pseudidiomarina terrestris]|uniref:GGDEF domain-containing protein n=1 Tax=Pseudidiomarina terrestris TaxID=2820060 RepID=UPI00264B44E4|nr:diguanylate cyclase [Pseudidiomarina sp. 1ASP75-5]MDN7135628.1 sensor domain-containing diguanylate cyclase [Pseudidiomarina sp. 1ASP75-5]